MNELFVERKLGFYVNMFRKKVYHGAAVAKRKKSAHGAPISTRFHLSPCKFEVFLGFWQANWWESGIVHSKFSVADFPLPLKASLESNPSCSHGWCKLWCCESIAAHKLLKAVVSDVVAIYWKCAILAVGWKRFENLDKKCEHHKETVGERLFFDIFHRT